MIQLFASFMGTNARASNTTPQFSVRPISPPTPQRPTMSWMFQGQNSDFQRSMESLLTQDPYQPVNSSPSNVNNQSNK